MKCLVVFLVVLFTVALEVSAQGGGMDGGAGAQMGMSAGAAAGAGGGAGGGSFMNHHQVTRSSPGEDDAKGATFMGGKAYQRRGIVKRSPEGEEPPSTDPPK